jgi:hypothetical protein
MSAGKPDDVAGLRRLRERTRGTRGGVALLLPAVLALAALLPAAAAFAQQQGAVVTGDHQSTDQAINAYISERAIQAQYARDLDIRHVGSTTVRAGFFFNEDRDLIFVGDLLAYTGRVQDPRDRRLEFRVGTRLYGAFLNVEDQDVFSIAIGGEAEWFFSKNRGASVLLNFYYAPDITTFGEANDISDTSLRLLLRLNDQADVFVGYRLFTFDQNTGDRDVDDNVHIGLQFRF